MALFDQKPVPRTRGRVAALLCSAALLTACGGYDVLRSSDAGTHAALAPHSLKVVLYDRDIDLRVEHHESGHGLAPAPILPDDKRRTHARAEQLKATLVQGLLQGVSNGLAAYTNKQNPACQLSLQINLMSMDLDGSVDVIVTATLTRGGGAIWLRTVRSGRNQFGSDAGLVDDLVRAVLAELRSGGLIA